ncbi:MAG: preprotein translocase subunit SecG [Archangium gephyra]|uniref:Protein-export membrane protein SecG n=1 Tax=Archangium gephyra TaxID=48 RepID=A0A2W5TM99_9BACT|nr:MAG: preprotein translocase subunit SecG [Archangium gephyra]
MLTFFTVVHVLLCVFMIFVILLQPGKDAGMGAALGGGAATTAFGGRGAATFLTKLTAACAIGFFLTSLGLSFVGLRSSVSDDLGAEPAAATTPVNTAVPAAPSEAAPANPSEATPKPAVEPAAPSANDAVPAEKLPNQ